MNKFCSFMYLMLIFASLNAHENKLPRARSKELAYERHLLSSFCFDQTMDPIVFKYLFSNNLQYAQDFADRLNAIIKVFFNLVSADICMRTHACLIFTKLQIEEPYNGTLQKVINELIPLYFDSHGCLVHLDAQDTKTRNFCIAQLLKNGIDNDTYKKLLHIFNFNDVACYEEKTSSYISENLYHFATGGWLPSITWYPHNIKQRIAEHAHNRHIEELLTLCVDTDFIVAHSFITTHSHPVLRELFTESYKDYTQKYCNACGIIKEYEDDPYWASLSPEDQAHYSNDLEKIMALNTTLKKRSEQKRKLQENWAIDEHAPTYVHATLFELLEFLETTSYCIGHIFEIMQKYSADEQQELQKALFLKNGILKQFALFSDSSRYSFPQQLFSEPDMLLEINKLFYLQHMHQNSYEGIIARITLDQLHAFYDPQLNKMPKLIDYDLETMQNPSFFTRMQSRIEKITNRMPYYTTTYTSIKKAIAYIISNFS
ncbi:MAG: hypothetical protein AB7F19_01625 [Candidatus Babeliales bacterium]